MVLCPGYNTLAKAKRVGWTYFRCLWTYRPRTAILGRCERRETGDGEQGCGRQQIQVTHDSGHRNYLWMSTRRTS